MEDYTYDIKNNRPTSIQLELPLAAYAQPKDDYCKKLLITLVISVLLALLVLLSWMSAALYSNHHTKATIVEESAARVYFNKNEQLLKSNSYDEVDDDFKITKLRTYMEKIKNKSSEDTNSFQTLSAKNEVSLEQNDDKSDKNDSETIDNKEIHKLVEKNHEPENGSSEFSENQVTTTEPDVVVNENKIEANLKDNNTQIDKSSIVPQDEISKSDYSNNISKVNETRTLYTAQ